MEGHSYFIQVIDIESIAISLFELSPRPKPERALALGYLGKEYPSRGKIRLGTLQSLDGFGTVRQKYAQ
jgi:hypothetical protein